MPRLRAITPVRTDCGVHFAGVVEEPASVAAAALFTVVECSVLHGRRGRWARVQSRCMLPVGMSAAVADARYVVREIGSSRHGLRIPLRQFDDCLQIRRACDLSALPHRVADPNGMDGWPTDDRDTVEAPSGKKPRKALSNWTYPVVEHGSLTAATLTRTHQRLEWSFVVQDSPSRSHRVLSNS